MYKKALSQRRRNKYVSCCLCCTSNRRCNRRCEAISIRGFNPCVRDHRGPGIIINNTCEYSHLYFACTTNAVLVNAHHVGIAGICLLFVISRITGIACWGRRRTAHDFQSILYCAEQDFDAINKVLLTLRCTAEFLREARSWRQLGQQSLGTFNQVHF